MIEKKEDRKLRGGYYTPKEISNFITKWVVQNKEDLILEPSCGDGVFIESAITRYLDLGLDKKKVASRISGIEIIPREAKISLSKFEEHNLPVRGSEIIVGDFFKNCKDWLDNEKSFDGILGNPPFIRYQDFKEEHRALAIDLMKRAGLKPNKLINAWIPFLVGSTLLLKSKGRLGMVLPAELFQVNYAAETRLFLSKFYSSIFIIAFKKLVFDDIQQEVVLFLGEKNGRDEHGINVIEVENKKDLEDIEFEKIKKNQKILNHSTEKWTQYFLEKKDIELLRKLTNHPEISLSGEHIDVDVGVVTGQNKYFLLNRQQVEKNNLKDHVTKVFGRSNQLKGAIVLDSDWADLEENNSSNYLLTLPNTEYAKLSKDVQNYIDYGASKEINLGYKCSIRKQWWAVPSVWVPDAVMLRQVHGYPKLINNKTNATVTDTLHRIKFKNKSKGKLVTAAFLNSLTFAFSEITGRSYGGGVLTFEPSEAERLPLPMKGSEKLDLKKIDSLLRENKIEEVLDENDKILLKEGLGLSELQIKSLRNIWIKMRDRRINRKR